MIDADVVEGEALNGFLSKLLADPNVAYAHAHFARPGRYVYRVDRAD
jgi:hypothetical protein